jgi:hypothetical protein
MKRYCLIAMLLVLGAGAATTPAHAIGVFGSYWNLDKGDGDGWGAGLRQDAPVSPLFALHTSVSWVNFSNANVDVFPIEAAVVAKIALLYGGIGGGYYFFSGDKPNLDNNWGWFVVAGAKLALGGLGVFGELKWNELSADVSGTSQSANLNGVGVNIGVTLGGK